MALISVVVLIGDEFKLLNRCINSLLNQTVEDIEIVLYVLNSDGGSCKGCWKVWGIESRVRVVCEEFFDFEAIGGKYVYLYNARMPRPLLGRGWIAQLALSKIVMMYHWFFWFFIWFSVLFFDWWVITFLFVHLIFCSLIHLISPSLVLYIRFKYFGSVILKYPSILLFVFGICGSLKYVVVRSNFLLRFF